jgi:hypothetical protein
MRTISKVLGYVGGIATTVISLFILIIVFLARLLSRGRLSGRISTDISAWTLVVMIFGIIGITGAAFITSRPKAGSILLLISGIGELVLSILVSVVSGRLGFVGVIEGLLSLLLLASGILGLISLRNQPGLSAQDNTVGGTNLP